VALLGVGLERGKAAGLAHHPVVRRPAAVELLERLVRLEVVAEPPKLYGPYVLIIILKTSNNHTWVPHNLRSLSDILGIPESSTIFQA
jgi:hypothetical protein